MHSTSILLGATRGVLTSKYGNKNFYKGTRGGRLGRFTPKGFILEKWRMRTFVVPDLSDFHMTPYVSKEAPDFKRRHTFRDYFREKNVPEDVDSKLAKACKTAALKAYQAIIAPKKPTLLLRRK